MIRALNAAEKLYGRTASVIVDTSPIGHVNAHVAPVSDGYVVIFQSGIKSFSNLMFKAIVSGWMNMQDVFRGVSSPDDIDIAKLPQVWKEPGARCLEILDAYLFGGDPIGAGFVELTGEAGIMSAELEGIADLFVVSHEYAHALEGHWMDARSDLEH